MKRILSSVTAVALWVGSASAYEVWMGTHLSTSEMATNLSDWSMTASQLEGFNVNRAPHDTDPASNAESQDVVATIPAWSAGGRFVHLVVSP